jgi:glutamate synthase domain-containing protein 1
LIEKFQDILDNYIKNISENYIAIHVRRTDNSEIAKINNNYTDDKDFFDFIEKNSDKKVFLATDNKETQELFIRKYGDRINIYKEILNSDSLRKTDLLNTIIDIYICSNAEMFLGSGWSSFTQLIRYLNESYHR